MIRLPFGKQGAALIWAALSVFTPVDIATAVTSAKNSGGKIAMARAQELFLNKNRQGAVKILLDARPSTTIKTTDREELNEAIKETATRFLTDKGQRSFELGISELPLQSQMALTHFREAQTLEDGNTQISEAIVRGLLAADDCKGAQKEMATLLPYNAIFAQIIELEVQLAWCLEDVAEVEALTKRKPLDQKLNSNVLKVASAWLKWRQNENDKAMVLLREAVAADSKNPAVLYWLWKIEKDQDLDAQAAATAFAKRCRNSEAAFRRRSSPMIEMCLHLSEVEAYLKAKGAESADAAL